MQPGTSAQDGIGRGHQRQKTRYTFPDSNSSSEDRVYTLTFHDGAAHNQYKHQPSGMNAITKNITKNAPGCFYHNCSSFTVVSVNNLQNTTIPPQRSLRTYAQVGKPLDAKPRTAGKLVHPRSEWSHAPSPMPRNPRPATLKGVAVGGGCRHPQTHGSAPFRAHSVDKPKLFQWKFQEMYMN